MSSFELTNRLSEDEYKRISYRLAWQRARGFFIGSFMFLMFALLFQYFLPLYFISSVYFGFDQVYPILYSCSIGCLFPAISMFFAAKQDAKDFFKFSAFSGLDTKYEFRDLGFCCENENNKIAPTWSDVHSWTMVEDYFVIYLDYFNFIALPLEKLTVTGTDLVIQLLKDSGLTRSGNVRK